MSKSKYFPELNEGFLQMLESLKGKKIAILGHMRPDGDCIGSQVAFAKFLRKYADCADVICINKDNVPYLYQEYLSGEKFIYADEFKDTSYDILTVDCASYERTSTNINELFPSPLGAIDHHLSNNSYAKFNLIDPTSASTTELISGLLLDCGFEIDEEMANALYVGLLMDTQQFTTNSTTKRSLQVAADLLERGADCAAISVSLYQKEKFEKTKLLARYLDRLELYSGGKACGAVLYKKDFEETNTNRKEDCEGIVDYARAVNGVEIAFLVEELDNGVKASLRSKNTAYTVNDIAGYFGGGGHACAAGCNTTEMSLEEFKEKLLELIAEKINKIG